MDYLRLTDTLSHCRSVILTHKPTITVPHNVPDVCADLSTFARAHTLFNLQSDGHSLNKANGRSFLCAHRLTICDSLGTSDPDAE